MKSQPEQVVGLFLTQDPDVSHYEYAATVWAVDPGSDDVEAHIQFNRVALLVEGAAYPVPDLAAWVAQHGRHAANECIDTEVRSPLFQAARIVIPTAAQ